MENKKDKRLHSKDTTDFEQKKVRKPRCDKGKKRLPRKRSRITGRSLYVSSKKELGKVGRRPCKRLKSEAADQGKTSGSDENKELAANSKESMAEPESISGTSYCHHKVLTLKMYKRGRVRTAKELPETKAKTHFSLKVSAFYGKLFVGFWFYKNFKCLFFCDF